MSRAHARCSPPHAPSALRSHWDICRSCFDEAAAAEAGQASAAAAARRRPRLLPRMLLPQLAAAVVGIGLAEGAPQEIRDHPKVQEVYFGSGKTFEKLHAEVAGEKA